MHPGVPSPRPPCEAFFLPRPGGQRLCVLHRPAGRARAAAVYLHPFAEEMNKSRRTVALQAAVLAAAGCAVLQVDLLGCGDSSGLLSDARWDDWLDDAAAADAWLAERFAGLPRWWWGLRTGCLLAGAAAARHGGPARLLLWQPPVQGKTLVAQFLRLKTAALLGDPAAAKAASGALRDALAAGQVVEIAGYPIAAALLQAMEAAVLDTPAPGSVVRCLETSTRPQAEVLPATAKLVAAWQAAGLDATAAVVPGPAFWQTTEIEEAPALLPATLAALGLADTGAPA